MRLLKFFMSLLSSIVLCTSITFAGEVTLAWDANDPTPTGYRIFAAKFGESYDYSNPLYEGEATSCTVEITNAAEYKFVARAYVIGASGEVYESDDSNEVKHAIVVWTNPNLRVQ